MVQKVREEFQAVMAICILLESTVAQIPEVYRNVHKSLPLVSPLSKVHPFHTTNTYVLL
jgi:hypothetical protein